ncbi:substrate-binding domain-containing protein, partial [Neobacillus drentensis]|uniref:substrate-binding domain-containing protein n=1 Tax=Neobacillus drentensis TaxID=220684 RepID=UPI0030016347
MRKTVMFVLGGICAVLIYFTFVSAMDVFRSNGQMPRSSHKDQSLYRLVLITSELETPFWDQVGAGAMKQAKRDNVSMEVWGSYGKNQEDFLKNIEIAIDSKVDGIIVQGLDSDAFKQLTKIKAAFYGIPIITVANDVPMAESLRKTYVGSDQYAAGQMIANQLIKDMGAAGSVVLLGDNRKEYYQQQRLSGIQDVLSQYTDIHIYYEETLDTREQVVATTRDLMNRVPSVKSFVALNANMADAMLQEIGNRSQIEPYYIYSFDDSPDSASLLKAGKIDGII